MFKRKAERLSEILLLRTPVLLRRCKGGINSPFIEVVWSPVSFSPNFTSWRWGRSHTFTSLIILIATKMAGRQVRAGTCFVAFYIHTKIWGRFFSPFPHDFDLSDKNLTLAKPIPNSASTKFQLAPTTSRWQKLACSRIGALFSSRNGIWESASQEPP